MNILWIIILIIKLLGFIYFIYLKYYNATIGIDYYVITMKSNDRLENIEKQLAKINNTSSKINIQQVDAVVGVNLDLKTLIDNYTLSPIFYDDSKHRKGEIGCAMSHLKVYNMIASKLKNSKVNNRSKYSVVFEDDFEILTPDFIQIVNSAIRIAEKEGFDMLLLGTNPRVYENGKHPRNKGVHIKGDVYHFNPTMLYYGAHAILINNTSIFKIIDELKYITEPFDQKIQVCAINGKFKILTLYPCIVEVVPEIKSKIRDN